MPALIALKAGRYQGRHCEPGDTFDCPVVVALDLVLSRRAKFANVENIDQLRAQADRERWADPWTR